MTDRSHYKTRKTRLADQGKENDLEGTTPEERLEMVWEITKTAWAFRGEPVDESTFHRDVVSVVRKPS